MIKDGHSLRLNPVGTYVGDATENGVVTVWRLTVKAQNIALEAPTEVREETKGHLVSQKDSLSMQRGL